jgi:hypothetical protein
MVKEISRELYLEFDEVLRREVGEINGIEEENEEGEGETDLTASWHDVKAETKKENRQSSSSLTKGGGRKGGRRTTLLDVKSGTFGSRQEVTFSSFVGPFCHVFEFLAFLSSSNRENKIKI